MPDNSARYDGNGDGSHNDFDNSRSQVHLSFSLGSLFSSAFSPLFVGVFYPFALNGKINDGKNAQSVSLSCGRIGLDGCEFLCRIMKFVAEFSNQNFCYSSRNLLFLTLYLALVLR